MNLELDEHFQEELNNLLMKFHKAIPEMPVVVAGGCLRDYLLCKDLDVVKDIDVFVGTTLCPYQLLEFIQSEFPNAKVEYNLVYTSNAECSGTISLGVAVLGKPVQLILVNRNRTVEGMIRRIDLGICQVGYSRYGFHTTMWFRVDYKLKTMTVVRCDSPVQAERTRGRFIRISQKHPGFKFIIPPKFERYFNEL